MDVDLAYYRRRQAEEKAATRSALSPAVRAAHHELELLYTDRIATLEAHGRNPDVRLVSVA